jgi:hypothetical protein
MGIFGKRGKRAVSKTTKKGSAEYAGQDKGLDKKKSVTRKSGTTVSTTKKRSQGMDTPVYKKTSAGKVYSGEQSSSKTVKDKAGNVKKTKNKSYSRAAKKYDEAKKKRAVANAGYETNKAEGISKSVRYKDKENKRVKKASKTTQTDDLANNKRYGKTTSKKTNKKTGRTVTKSDTSSNTADYDNYKRTKTKTVKNKRGTRTRTVKEDSKGKTVTKKRN